MPTQPDLLTTPTVGENIQLCPMYRVLIHNDPVTTMDFVIKVLREVFEKKQGDAFRIMEEANTSGVALVEVVPLERAEMLVDKAHSLARTAKFPLTFTYEPAE